MKWFFLVVFFVQFFAINAWAERYHSNLFIKNLSENHHIITFGNSVILDDQNDAEGFNQGLEFEEEARFGDRIHYIVSQSSKDKNCPKVYRIITLQDAPSITEKFGKCLKYPSVDKYADGSMDVLFDGKKTIYYTSENKIQERKKWTSEEVSRLNNHYQGNGKLSLIYKDERYDISGLPAFEDFPSKTKASYELAKDIDWQSYKGSWNFRTRLRAGLKKGANFNGHYAVVTHGCGTSCQVNWIVNAQNGKVLGRFSTTYGASYRMDSGLIISDYPSAEAADLSSYGTLLSHIIFYKVENDELIRIRDLDVYKEIKKLQKDQ